jgi:hypothetical protein
MSTENRPPFINRLGSMLIAMLLGVLVIFTVFALFRRVVYLVIDHGQHPLDTALLVVGICSAIYLFWQVRKDGLKLTWRVGPAALVESVVAIVLFSTIDLPMLPVAAKFVTAEMVTAASSIDTSRNPASKPYNDLVIWRIWDLDGSRDAALAEFGNKAVVFKVVPTYCAGWQKTRTQIGYEALPPIVRQPFEVSEVRCAQLRGDERAVIQTIETSASVVTSNRPGGTAVATADAIYHDHQAALTILKTLKKSDPAQYASLHPRPGSPLDKLMHEADHPS